MAVSISAAGQGKLRLPGTPSLKPALSSGSGWWMAFAHRTPPALGGATTQIVGSDATGNGTYADGNEAGISLGSNSIRKYAFFLRAGSTDCWVAAGATNSFEGQSAVSLGADYLVIWGVKDMTGAGDWRLFRVVCPINGSIIGSEVTAGNALITTFAGAAHRGWAEVFADYSTNPRTPAGTALEHLVCVQGDFPFATGVPDPAIVQGLADGTYQYDDAAVLNGGTILDWRKLANATDLGNYGSNGVGALAVYSGASPGGSVNSASALLPWNTFAMNEPPDGLVFEGIKGPATFKLTGEKPSGVTIEAQIELTDGTVFSAWSTTGLSEPTATTWELNRTDLTARTDGKDYKVRIRDAADHGSELLSAGAWGVGFVVVWNGQSQFERFASGGTSTGAPTATPNQCRVLYPQDRKGTSSTAVVCRRLDQSGVYGSAYITAATEVANQLGATHVPVMFVDICYQGESIDEWRTNHTPSDATWSLWTGYTTTMMAACGYRATAMARADVINTSMPEGIGAALDDYLANWDALLVNNPAPMDFWLVPPVRGGDKGGWISDGTDAYIDPFVYALIEKGRSGGRFRLLCYLADWQMDGLTTNHHQANGALGDTSAEAHIAGNRRGGHRMGAGIAAQMAKALGTPALDALGPRILSAIFTSAGKTAIDVTFDRDIHVPDLSTTGLKQFWITSDAWATAGNTKNSNDGAYMTAAIISDRVVRLTKTSGSWSGSLKVAYLRDTFDTTAGGESTIRTTFDGLIYDTSSVEGGRGIVALPYSRGVAVRDVGTVIISAGEAADLTASQRAAAKFLTVEDAVSDGAGLASFRWKSGAGETGTETGVDVTLNVTA